MKSFLPARAVSRLIAVFGLLLMCAGARAQTLAPGEAVLFDDEFNASSLDNSFWNVTGTNSSLHRTQYGNTPEVTSAGGDSFARFNLDTYNPDPAYKGSYLRGTEIASRQTFRLGNGVEFETRMRGNNISPGIIWAFFTYGERGLWPNGYLKEEIDFEILGNQPINKLWLNIWDDWNSRYGGGNKHTQDANIVVSGLDWTGWNTYKIRWLNDRTQFIVNGNLVREETNVLPDDEMHVRFNIWAANSGWGAAYSSALQPTSNSSNNENHSYDVDYIRVKRLAPGSGALGTGGGLNGDYFDNADFTNKKVSRIDSRVNFDWSSFSPDISMGTDTFSVRWSGQVQAKFSESYTFYTSTDDGVRLWVNGQKLIDKWINQGETEYSGNITLQAGKKYSITMEYYDNTGGAAAHLLWKSASTPKQVVPQSQLYASGDNVAPQASFLTPGDNWSYKTLAALTGTSSDSGGSNLSDTSIRLQRLSDSKYWNGANWNATAVEMPASGYDSWSFALPSLSDSRYKATAVARDNAGNLGSADRFFWIDNNNPTATITTPTATSYATPPNATGTASDPGAGLASVTVRLQRQSDNRYWNGSSWTTSASEVATTGLNNWSFNLSWLSPGSYNLRAQASDYVGNIGVSAVVAFSIGSSDTTPPNVSFSSPTQSAYVSTLATVTGAAPDRGSGLNRVQLVIQRLSDNLCWNGSAWVSGWQNALLSPTITNASTGAWSYNSGPSTLNAGGYWLYQHAYDNIGNGAEGYITVSASASIGGRALKQAQGFALSGRIVISGGGGVSNAPVSLRGEDGSQRATMTNANGEYSFTGVSPGNYTVTPNKAGLTFAPTSRTGQVADADVNGVDFVASNP